MGHPGDRDRCLQAGMDDYLTKPVSKEKLAAILRQYLSPRAGDQEDSPTSDETPDEEEIVIFDRDALIERLGDDKELCDELIELFAEDFGGRVELMKRALEESSTPDLVAQAHTIKGASANIEAKAINARAKAIEDAARDGDLEQVRILTDKLENDFHAWREVAMPSD